MRTLSAWVFATSCCACDGKESMDDEVAECGASDPICVTDRVTHTAYAGRCVDSSGCPAGLDCLPSPSPSLECADERTCRAVPDDSRYAAGALVQGFGAPPFVLTSLGLEGGAAFTWMPPKDTVVVACALFGCTPEVSASSERQPDGSFVRRIANFDQCVLAEEAFPGGSGTFALDFAPTRKPVAPTCDTASATTIDQAISALVVGCWSYDGTRINGATSLVEVPLAKVPQRLLPSTAADCSVREAEGASCLVSETPQVIGACIDGACRRRCGVPEDCAREVEDSTSSSGDAVEDEIVCCRPGPGAGVCLPVDRAPAELCGAS